MNNRLSIFKVSLALVFIVFASTTLESGGKRIKYGKFVPIGFQVVKLGDACVSLKATMSEGDFFGGLERVDTKHGPEYYSRGKLISMYPDMVSVEIEAIATGCGGPIQPIPVRQGVKDLLASLQFQAVWDLKEGPQPINISYTKRTGQPSWTELANGQYFTFDIDTKEAPLTEHLVVRVLAQNSDMLAQFSTQL